MYFWKMRLLQCAKLLTVLLVLCKLSVLAEGRTMAVSKENCCFELHVELK